jgi:pilus assembly protein CpaD
MFTSTDRIFGAAARLVALGLALGATGCQTDQAAYAPPPPFPTDVRDRYPIKITETERAIEIFGGSGHGRLTASQRAEVAAFARSWRRESSGRLHVDVPVGVRAQSAVAHTAREVVGVIAAMGVPPAAIERRPYRPAEPMSFGPIRVSYPRLGAVAGPCGATIGNMGPGIQGIENDPYWNHGCSTQQNLAAMIANPEDLVQPRAEDRPDATRRQVVIEKWRQGQDPSTVYTTKSDSKVSTVGQ